MVKFLVMFMVVMLSSSAFAQSRDELLNKLYQLQGWPQASEMQKKMMQVEFSKEFAIYTDNLSKAYVLRDEDKKQVERLNSQFVTAIISVDTPENAMAFWKQNFGVNFTDEELAELIKTEESPLQRKVHDAKFAVGSKLNGRYYDLLRGARDKAITDYYAQLEGILKHCGCQTRPKHAAKPR